MVLCAFDVCWRGVFCWGAIAFASSGKHMLCLAHLELGLDSLEYLCLDMVFMYLLLLLLLCWRTQEGATVVCFS